MDANEAATLRSSDGDTIENGEPDPLVSQFRKDDLKIASESFINLLPFLTRDLCSDCSAVLSRRIRSLVRPEEGVTETSTRLVNEVKEIGNRSALGSLNDAIKPITRQNPMVYNPRMSWADMVAEEEEIDAVATPEDEIFDDEEEDSASNFVDTGNPTVEVSVPSSSPKSTSASVQKPKLSRQERVHLRFSKVKRNKEYICFERVKGKLVNILEGLELHEGIFNTAEQKRIVDFVYKLQDMGRNGELKERTYSAPHKWTKGKGRVTIQFGCCYNYSTDKIGNPPGILKSEIADPLPNLFKTMIRRLISWHVLPQTCVPDSCVVHIYEEQDCIPPHKESNDFTRPFCTVSLLSECNVVFGTSVKILGPGDFRGAFSIPLPLGSVLVLNGNAADVAKHCVPSFSKKRISITFRKMEESKRPNSFVLEPDLQDVKPFPCDSAVPGRAEETGDEGDRREPRGRRDRNVYSCRGRRGGAYAR